MHLIQKSNYLNIDDQEGYITTFEQGLYNSQPPANNENNDMIFDQICVVNGDEESKSKEEFKMVIDETKNVNGKKTKMKVKVSEEYTTSKEINPPNTSSKAKKVPQWNLKKLNL